MSIYQHLIRPLLFRCDPESVHERAMDIGERFGASVAGRNLLKGLFAFADERLSYSGRWAAFCQSAGHGGWF
ncbi:MAG: hypothetical protein ACJ0UT_07160 [Candidatus Latescibacterota bacterium]